MEKFYSVVLADNKSGDEVVIESRMGLAMARHMAEVYCKNNGIKNVVRRPKNCEAVPASKRQVVWTCDMPATMLQYTVWESEPNLRK